MNKNYEKILIENIEDYDSNLRGIELEYIKNGITIIVGENNTGKTNLLNWLFKNADKFVQKEIIDPFFQVKPHQENLEALNKTWDESYMILRYPSKRKIFHSVYYLDLETSIYNFFPEGSNSKKIKYLEGELISDYVNKVEINRRLGKHEAGLKEWIEEALKIKAEDNFDIIIESGTEDKDLKVKAINIGKLHSPKNTGSGNWKFWILSIFSHIVSEFHKKKSGMTDNNSHICRSTLLIDEPELFLHPQRIKEVANSIKKTLEKNELTIILTTHSPIFLSHFIHEEKQTNLVIVQKEKGYLKKPLCLWKIIDNIKERIKEDYKKYARDSEKIKGEFTDSSYINKWKRLLSNKEVLKFLFSKKILFVEGPVECILFDSVLREELREELKDIEIIPIFGKFHYIFFANLVERLGLKYWFMIDDDRKKYSTKLGEIEWVNKEDGWFWEDYSEGVNNEENKGVFHTERTKISWVHFNVEEFLEIPMLTEDRRNKEYNLISRADKVIANLKEKHEKLKLLKEMLSFLKK